MGRGKNEGKVESGAGPFPFSSNLADRWSSGSPRNPVPGQGGGAHRDQCGYLRGPGNGRTCLDAGRTTGETVRLSMRRLLRESPGGIRG